MKRLINCILILTLLSLWVGCGPERRETDLHEAGWDKILEKARGSTVTLMMWQGDPNINRYMNGYVKPELKKRYGINLEIASGQGNKIVSILMTELQAGKQTSEIDMMWINGETFYQLRQIEALYGPFTGRLPNAKYVDFENPFIKYDFQQPIDGYECPWGNVQWCMIYNREKTKNPPRNMDEIEAYVRAHPGSLTIPTEFTGMTFLKSLLIAIAGEGTLDGPYDEEKYEQYSRRLWRYINGIKPYLWKKGETFPSTLSSMHQMFASGELHFTMSNNDAEVDNKVLEGFFPESARAYALDSGTIQNSHYIGIVKHSGSKAAAMVVCNFLISPEAQYRKMNPTVWGDGTVLSQEKLPSRWEEKFRSIADRKYTPPREVLQQYALQELAPEYMIRLYEDFRSHVVQR
ncbi:MAG: ABC transporter substrate-binding protein [Balneolaceae bacterium]|nr:ABC transporter substrate-binding protein [Balneolaceae bacterium]